MPIRKSHELAYMVKTLGFMKINASVGQLVESMV